MRISTWTSSIALIMLCGCGVQIDRGANTPDQAMSFSLVRIYQEVKRYDCKGNLTSDQIEIVQDSRTAVTFSPLEGSSTDATFTNVTNNHQPGSMTISGSGQYYTFHINITDTVLDLKVEDGLNQIHYKFVGESVPDEGDVYLRVSYSQSTAPGFLEIHPSPEDCNPH